MALRFGKLEDALVSAGAPAQKAAEAAEEVADVVELLHRMERRLVRALVLISSTLGGLGWSLPACSRPCSSSTLADRR